MQNRLALDLQVDVAKDAPTVLIYSDSITERLDYCIGFIFNTVLKLNYRLTTDREAFENSTLFRINYSATTLSGVVNLAPEKLLFETGVSDKKPKPYFKNEDIYFYPSPNAGEPLHFHFDIFAAVFYFISRYEEWQVYEKDSHGRFEAAESLLFRNNFHLKPVVDRWIAEFMDFLVNSGNGLAATPKSVRVISTIDVDNLYAFKKKGLVRTLGACAKDLVRFDLSTIGKRLKVLAGKTRDPFDVYAEITEFCSGLGFPMIWFFLLRSCTRYDRTVDPQSGAFEEVFNTLQQKGAAIGLHPSYHAIDEKNRLQTEAAEIRKRLGVGVNMSRQHYLRFDIRSTPQLLMDNGIKMDASMGFASTPGFRAGTSHPFNYYDLSSEKRSELLFLPFCTMDGAYFVYTNTSTADTMKSMLDLAAEIKKTGGYFISVFHERTFSDHLYPGFGTLYKNLHLRLKEI